MYSVRVRKFDTISVQPKIYHWKHLSVCWLSEDVVDFKIEVVVYKKFGKM